ncbi:MAG: formyltransferase family protein [Phycisphaerales bacterium]|nr:formyltransferase family protein [Phycisphaerales bacterium]
MKKKRIVFLGSKPIGYECLHYLIAQQESLNVEVIGILTQVRKEFGDNHDLIALAKAHQIPVIASLNDMPECDILYSVQYHQILKAEDIAKAKLLSVNLHMAPLPEYRGSNQFSFAIIDGKEEFGTTIHKMDTRIDHGDILFQKRFDIPHNCWAFQLYELTYEASYKLFCQTLAHIISGNFKAVAQADLVASKGSSLHYRHEIIDLKRIDLSWSEEKIKLHIRATTMPGFEPPYCEVNKRKIYFSTSCQND